MKKICLFLIVFLMLVGCTLIEDNNVKEENDDVDKDSTMNLEVGSLGSKKTKYDLDDDISIYIEDGKVVYNNKKDDVKIIDETISDAVIYLEAGRDCNGNIYLAVLTENGVLYYNTNQTLDKYDFSFMRVDIDSTVYGIESKDSKDNTCQTDLLFAYTDERVSRKIEEKLENDIIVGLTLSKTYDELYAYEDIFKDGNDKYNIYIYNDKTMSINIDDDYIIYNDDKLKMQYLFATTKQENGSFEIIYIVDNNDYLYSVNYNSINDIKRVSDKKVYNVKSSDDSVTITYNDDTEDIFTDSIMYES